eukprot:6548686-Prymnesium_polylepis.1
MPAVLLNTTLIECSAPECRAPACLADGEDVREKGVSLEVSLNGVTFTDTGLMYTYYDMRHVHVSTLTPRGGPLNGATRLRVAGYGFRDLTGGVGGYRQGFSPAHIVKQGLHCKLGANAMVYATIGRFDLARSSARCVAPIDTTWPASESTQIHEV